MAKKLFQAFPGVATADLAKFGEQKKGMESVQHFLRRFGYLKGETFKSGEVDVSASDALRKYQERNGLPITGDFDSATQAQMISHRCGVPDMQNGVAFVTSCAWNRRRLTFAFNNGTGDVASD